MTVIDHLDHVYDKTTGVYLGCLRWAHGAWIAEDRSVRERSFVTRFAAADWLREQWMNLAG